jgi:hypothetical protein
MPFSFLLGSDDDINSVYNNCKPFSMEYPLEILRNQLKVHETLLKDFKATVTITVDQSNKRQQFVKYHKDCIEQLELAISKLVKQ